MTASTRRRMARPDVVQVGTGPLMLDVTLARALGWTEAEIREVSAHLEFLARDHAEHCAERYPDRFARVDGVVVFLGELPTS